LLMWSNRREELFDVLWLETLNQKNKSP